MCAAGHSTQAAPPATANTHTILPIEPSPACTWKTGRSLHARRYRPGGAIHPPRAGQRARVLPLSALRNLLASTGTSALPCSNRHRASAEVSTVGHRARPGTPSGSLGLIVHLRTVENRVRISTSDHKPVEQVRNQVGCALVHDCHMTHPYGRQGPRCGVVRLKHCRCPLEKEALGAPPQRQDVRSARGGLHRGPPCTSPPRGRPTRDPPGRSRSPAVPTAITCATGAIWAHRGAPLTP